MFPNHRLLQIRRLNAFYWVALCLGHLATFSSTGCDADEGQQNISESTNAVTLDEGEVAVAVVDGVPITTKRVAHLAKETGRSPQEVVEGLIDFELLAAEAERRGLADDDDVIHTARKAMIQRYLEREFEGQHSISHVPDEVVERAYAQNIQRFKHPRLRKVAHILVMAKVRSESKERRAKAHRLAGEIAREARKAPDLSAFRAIGKRFNKTQGFNVHIEEISTAVHDNARLVRPFIDAAMALEKAGDISPPVQTQFGSHVIYLIEAKEPVDRSLEEVHDEVAEHEHPFWLKAEFAKLVETLRLSGNVKGYVGEKRRSAQR